MLKPRYIAAASVALALAGCASDPAYYSEPRYSSAPVYNSSAPVYNTVAYGDSGRVVAIDVVRGGGRTSGGGAVAGAIIGQVLGKDRKGTIIGAAAGAAAGGAAAAATANFDGCVNNGAQITIKLNSAMTVATR